ncbi:MAG: Stp1/IreP family PP2C-type Ser/Thr phosphatase [Bacillota bacterium]
MEWIARSEKGLVRPNNEDNLLTFPEIGLFAVADGMGGHQAGEVASRLAIECLKITLSQGIRTDPLPQLMTAAGEANRVVYAAAQENKEYGGMGTTLTACVIQAQSLYWVHIGDSRGYLIRNDEITQFTRDHSLVSTYVRQGKLTPEEAESHPYRNVLSRALGTEPATSMDSGSVNVFTGDRIVLCTDGLTNHLAAEDILNLLRQGGLEEQAGALIDLALERGGKDNVTLILISITD